MFCHQLNCFLFVPKPNLCPCMRENKNHILEWSKFGLIMRLLLLPEQMTDSLGITLEISSTLITRTVFESGLRKHARTNDSEGEGMVGSSYIQRLRSTRARVVSLSAKIVCDLVRGMQRHRCDAKCPNNINMKWGSPSTVCRVSSVLSFSTVHTCSFVGLPICKSCRLRQLHRRGDVTSRGNKHG